ncbi:type IV pilin protein [Lysobacter enzymogenes]|uniref:type IV pilin protein n=1 Tax=Lysobacter enzymogenes TaxID=69 RepID=UPI001A9783FD|nr:type IV pilin protein [Lysobacter enzymogenes]QQP98108.1 type IV pilin protein [Lysobacter enzymogenes]
MKRGCAGFTLIELMIVLAVVAILTAMAYQSYQAQILKSRRAVATACLMEQVQTMERYYTTKFSYSGAKLSAGGCVNELSAFYTFGSTINAATYSLTAEPKGAQAKDAKCMKLSIDQAGVKGKTGSAGDVLDCW